MLTGVIHGPYARQITDYKLKFWFVLVLDDGEGFRRYELGYERNQSKSKARYREVFTGKVPQYKANFTAHLPPVDLSPYGCTHFPRFERDRIADAAASLLQGQDIADVVKLTRFGIVPELARYGINGDLKCISKLLLPF